MAKKATSSTSTSNIAQNVADQLAQRAAFGAVLGESSPLIAKADKAITSNLKTTEEVRKSMYALVVGLRDLGVPSGDAGVLDIIQNVLNDHVNTVGGKDSKVGSEWVQWMRPIKQALYYGLSYEGVKDADGKNIVPKFGKGLRNEKDYPLPGKDGKVGKSGSVKTTTLNSMFITASKLLEQMRLLGYTDQSGDLFDWIKERWDTFVEVGDDGKPL